MSYRAFDGYTSPQTSSGINGSDTLVRSQSATGSLSIGGNINIKSGTGIIRDGYVTISVGNNDIIQAVPNKINLLSGQRINITPVSTSPFNIFTNQYTLIVNCSSIAITLNLPTNPITGDIYQVKDTNGNAATNNITVNGNGFNIDSSISYIINSNYGTVLFVFTGTKWNVL